jgi:hypothetical protein
MVQFLKNNWFKILICFFVALLLLIIIHREYRITIEQNYQITKFCFNEDGEGGSNNWQKECMNSYKKFIIH